MSKIKQKPDKVLKDPKIKKKKKKGKAVKRPNKKAKK